MRMFLWLDRFGPKAQLEKIYPVLKSFEIEPVDQVDLFGNQGCFLIGDKSNLLNIHRGRPAFHARDLLLLQLNGLGQPV